MGAGAIDEYPALKVLGRRLVPLSLAVTLFVCTGCETNAVYLGLMRGNPSFERVDSDLSGPAIGWQGGNGGDSTAGFLEFQALEDKTEGLNLWNLNMGIRTPPSVHEKVEVRGQLDLGFGSADLVGLQNSNTLISVGVGIQPAVELSETVAVIGLFGWGFRNLCG